MEDEFKPSVQPQRPVNPNIKEVVKKEVIELLDAGLIYPISDSPWVSTVQVVLNKGGMTVVKNEKDELILQWTVTGWRAPIMIKLDWSLPFKIMCDASDYAVGAVLGQRIDKHFKPIHYASKTINKAQENYMTVEKELLEQIPPIPGLIQDNRFLGSFCLAIPIHKTRCETTPNSMDLIALGIPYRYP
nr:hypothetical protein [Tanacetum cinerariifolium]